MTRDLATSLLNLATNGNQLMHILESIAADEQQQPAPTSEPIAF